MTVRFSLLLTLILLAVNGKGAPAAESSAITTSSTSATVAAETKTYDQRVERELRDNILKFWITHVVDREHGGFYGEISNDLVVRKNAARGALLTSRILWTYSAAYRRYHDAAYLEMATWAYNDLVEHFWDKEHGGLFWTITAAGEPQRTEKQIYGQVFGIYALSEFYRATDNRAALEHAIKIYRLIEEHAHDSTFGGYFEVCARDWQRDQSRMRSAMETRGSKSQNTHLHVLEAYTNLLRAWPDEGLKKSQSELIELMLTKILDQKTHHLVLFMGDDWSPRGDGISFGHDIEASWLLTEAADVMGDEALTKRVRATALEIARVTLEQGIDTDGSLLYEANAQGVTDTNREWWPQAEAAVGFMNAYQLSGDERYRAASLRLWDYIEAQLVDHENGEWFRARSKSGVPSRQPKVSLWKCPYHNGRACMELTERLSQARTER